MDLIKNQADVSFANESLNRNTQYINEIDSAMENFTKEHKAFKETISDNQQNYEKTMADMENNFQNFTDDNKELLKKLNASFSSYKVLQIFKS